MNKNIFATTIVLRRVYHALLESDNGLTAKQVFNSLEGLYPMSKINDALTFLTYVQVAHKIPTPTQNGVFYRLDDSYFGVVK